jgi:ABC-type lipoprotein export system ATPase subunit
MNLQLTWIPQPGQVLEVLRELQLSGSQTLILVTHDPDLATLAFRRIQLEQLRRVDS